MVKRLFSIVAVVALFSGLAMAQAVSDGGLMEGPTIVAAQAVPPGGCEEGPQPRVFQMRMRGHMGQGPDVMFYRHGRGSWWKDPEVARRIGLSDQQIQQLDKISQDGRLKMIDLRADLEKQEVILAPMMQAYHPDETQVLAQVEKVSQARAALAKAGVQTMLASRNVLTEEQWKKLHDTRMEFHRAFGRRALQRPARPRLPAPPPGK